MRVYWDTSAAINAAVSAQVFNRLKSDEHCTRAHLFAEFISTMTGRGIPVKDKDGNPARLMLTPNDAAAWLRTFSSKVRVERP